MFKLHSIAVSNRFVAEGFAASSAGRQAALELTNAAADQRVALAFTSGLLFTREAQSRRELEVIAFRENWETLACAPGFRRGAAVGWIKHMATGVPIRLHAAGRLVLGGPVCWPDPAADADYSDGIPVLRLNAYLETEITRALNSPDGAGYASNVVAAIRAAGAQMDRALELHPYVMWCYQELWELAQAGRAWPAVA